MMKRKIFTFLLVLGVAWSLHSCDNNDDESIAVPVELQSTFSAKYPNATNVEWENKYGYYVADFYDGHEASAWFTQDGKWQMTETDIPYSALPQAVKTSFEKSEYASWKKNTIHATYPGRVDDDDTEYVEEATGATYYLIDIENSEIDVKIRADGQILD